MQYLHPAIGAYRAPNPRAAGHMAILMAFTGRSYRLTPTLTFLLPYKATKFRASAEAFSLLTLCDANKRPIK